MLGRFRRFSLILFGLVLMAQSPSPAPVGATGRSPLPQAGSIVAQANPPAKTSLAVYPIKPAGSDAALATAMTSLLVSELTPSPKLQVIEEALLKTVMERQGLNASDACDDTSCQVDIGKLIKAQKMIVGDLTKFGNKYILAVKLVDIQSGVVEFTGQDKCTCTEDNLDSLVAAVAARVRNHFGEQLPIPALPQAPAGGQAFVPVQPSATPQGAQAFLPVQPQKTFQEFHPTGTKGGPMVYVSDFKFYIDKYEVTNQDFQECVSAGACKETKKQRGFDAPKQPVVYVNQDDARTYCQWAGKRLPKEQEWQEAAQGTDGRIYPWGNDSPNCNLANYDDCKIGQTLAVGSKPAGASPYGALDMAGNVWEWVEEKGGLRGGGWFGNPAYLRVSHRYTNYAGGARPRNDNYGFRCARDGS
jgi:serine/threonine-protein kinase